MLDDMVDIGFAVRAADQSTVETAVDHPVLSVDAHIAEIANQVRNSAGVLKACLEQFCARLEASRDPETMIFMREIRSQLKDIAADSAVIVGNRLARILELMQEVTQYEDEKMPDGVKTVAKSA